MVKNKDTPDKIVKTAIRWSESGGAVAVDGRLIGSHQKPQSKRNINARPIPDIDPNIFVGPKLKIKRAKKHISELEALLQAFHQTKPYEPIREDDAKTGEYVYRVRIHKPIPVCISAIIGDIVHNLRSALDQLICDLVLANRKQIRRGTGFPISATVKHFEKASVGKIKGISTKADRFIRRLKPYKGGNTPLWILHELDALDKHQGIIPVAAANVAVMANWSTPLLSVGDGKIYIGSVPPGAKPLGTGFGIPTGFVPVCPLEDNSEIYRSVPATINEELQITILIAFGQTQITQGEPVLETLQQLAIFIERTMTICETKII